MPNFSGIWTPTQQFQARAQNIWPAAPGAPTIGTATAGTSNCASVTFTAPAYTGYPAGVSSYTAISAPGCVTASGASSPLVVTGLTSGTSYTFRVRATGASGVGPLSGASNSITATVKTCATYTTPGTYSWVAPAGVTSVAAVAIGGGQAGTNGFYCCGTPIGGCGGDGGSLSYRNSQSVTPGTSYTVTVGSGGSGSSGASGGNSLFISNTVLQAVGGFGFVGPNAGTFSSLGGESYGNSSTCNGSGGGGAGGYAGTGAFSSGTGSGQAGAPKAGAGGGGGGGGSLQIGFGFQRGGSGGGGTGVFGQGADGAAGTRSTTTNVNGLPGGGGSGGANGIQGSGSTAGAGGGYGGGGGGGIPQVSGSYAAGASGAVRIVWAGGSRGTPSFPSTNVGA